MNKKPSLFAKIVVAAVALTGCMEVSAQVFQSGTHEFEVDTQTATWIVPQKISYQQYSQKPEHAPSLRYLLYDRQRSLVGSEYLSFRRFVIQPWSQDGLEDAAQISIDFSPAYQKLTLHWIDVYRNGKRLQRLQPDKVKLIQQEKDIEKLLYDGRVTALAVLEDIRIGDVIDYAFTIDGHNPVLGEKYSTRHSMGWGTPIDRLHLRLRADEDRKFFIKNQGTRIQPGIERRDGIATYTWQMDNVAAVDNDGQTPDWFDPYPRIYVSEYRDWREVKRWAEQLYGYDDKLSDQLLARVRQWRRLGSEEQKILAALALVQQEVRYFGVEMGQNSHRPSHPNEVFKRRFGDCKDKAQLLVALLREMDIDAWPALVSNEQNRGVADWLPSPKAFDHVIVKVRLKGETFWLDGTRNHQHGKLARLGLPDLGLALVIGADEDLTTIEYGKHNQPFIDVEEKFFVEAYDEPVSMTVISRYHGAEAEERRQYFGNKSHQRIQQDYLNYYARSYPGIGLLRQLEVTDLREENIFEVREFYHISDFWEREDTRLYSTLRGSTLSSWLTLPDTVKRRMPLGINHPFKMRHRASISYPEDIDFEIDNEVLQVESPAFSFRRHADYEPNTLSVSFEISTRNDHVGTAEIKQHLKRLRETRSRLRYSTWVREPTKLTQQRRFEETNPMVDELIKRLSDKK